MKKGFPSLLQKALFAILLIILPISIVFIHDFLGVKEELRVNEINQNRAMAEGYEGMVYEFLEMSKRRAQDFSSDGEIRSALQGMLDGKRDFDKQLSKYLSANKLPLDKSIHRIDVASLDGKVLASTEGSETGRSLDTSILKGIGGAAVSEVRAGASATPSIVISAPILSKATGRPIGIIANSLHLSELNRLLRGDYSKEFGALSWNMAQDETVKAYIVNREGVIVSGVLADAMLGRKVDTLPVTECRNSNKEISGIYRNYQGVEVVGASMCMPEMGWTLLVEADAEKVLKHANEMLSNALILGAIIVGFILLLGVFFIRKMVMPLRMLAKAADSLAGGDYSVSLPVRSQDEMGDLTKSFNIMAGEIRKRTEIIVEGQKKLSSINRLYLILSKINEAIVHIHDREKLLEEACRIIVDDGGFQMSWVGIADPSTLVVKPVAHCCGEYEGSYIDGLVVSVKDLPEGHGPTGTAIREGRHVISNDIENDPSMAPWCDRALRYGYRSSAAFPLRLGTNVMGAVTIYSGDPHFFNNEEIELLDALTADISFAVESIEAERQARQADLERLRAQQRYERLVDNLPVGIYRSTPGERGRFIEANPALVGMLEAGSKEELFSHDASDFYEDRNKRRELSDKILKNGFIEDEVVEIVTLKGNRIWVSFSTVMKKDDEGNIYFDGVLDDITEQKKLESQLRHSQKMEAVGQLAGGIAHDFNNALTAILGFANLLIMKKGDDELVRSYAEHILGAGSSAANLVQGILAFSRKQTTIRQPVDIRELVGNIYKILSRLIGEDIELRVVYSEAPLIVKVDHTQIEQVLMNLATNARDAIPDRGAITISTELAKIDGEFIKAHGYGEAGPYAMISFADTGMGMDEETKRKIFEPFFTTKEVGKGTGLGLSMIYGIIKHHDGFINVYSEPGKGTNFKIYLPLADLTSEARESKESFFNPPRGTETVLLAEDDERVRGIVLRVLDDFGYNVIIAVNGEDAVTKFRENKDKIQLCISDMVMPKMGGREVYEEIRKIRPDIKFIFMSGYAADKTKMIIEDGLDFIEKPVSPSDFLRKVREVLDR